MSKRKAQTTRGPANRRVHPPREPDSGVTVIVGLLLAIGILTALLVNYRLQWVPLAMEDKQAEHMETVNQQMGALVATLDKQLIGEVNTTVSTPLQIGVEGQSFPSMAPVSHRMIFDSASGTDRGLSLSSSQFRTFQQDGAVIAALANRGTTVASDDKIEEILAMDHLRVNISSVAGTSGTLEVQLQNASDANVGWLEISISRVQSGPNFQVGLEVRDTDSTGNVLYRETRFNATTSPTTTDPYFVNLLNKDLVFDQLMSAAEGPYNLTFTESSLTTRYEASYEDADGVHQPDDTGGGVTDAPWSFSLSSASLRYEANNPEYVDQSLVIEGGALLLKQSDGAAFIAEPRLVPDQVDQDTVIALTVPRLSLADQQLTGVTKATIKTTPVESGSILGWATDLSVTWHTDHPRTWRTFLNQSMLDAGIPSTHWSTSVDQAAGTATLTVDGADLSGTDEDVLLILKHTRIKAEVLK